MRLPFVAAALAALSSVLVATACGSAKPCGDLFCDAPDGGGVDAVSTSDAPSFPDSPLPTAFDVEPAADQTITVGFNQTTPTVGYSAFDNNKSPLSVAWTTDQGAIGTVSPTSGTQTTFVPTGNVGGLVNVNATYQKQTIQRRVLVKLTGSGNGNCPSSQIATTTTQLMAGGGVGGVGGEGCGGAVTDQPTLTALANPSSGTQQNLAFMYPYDKTVFPRGLLAPLLQWSSALGDADAIKIDLTTTSGSFSWSGTFARPAILTQSGGTFVRHPIPQDVWKMATETAGMLINNVPDQLTVSLTIAKGGVAYGPIKETWTVAPGDLKGTVYYGTYGTRLSTSNWSSEIGASVLAIKHGATDPYLVTSKTRCQVCHSVPAKGSDLAAEDDFYPGNGADYDVYYDLKSPSPPGANFPQVSGLYTWPGITPDGTLMFSNSSLAWQSGGLEGSTNTPSGLYSLPSGSIVVTPAQIQQQLGISGQLGGTLPEFSPDGKHVVFTYFQGGTGADNKSLAVVDFDQTTKAFSNLRVIYTPTCAGCTAVAPFFTPTSDAVVFELNTVSNGYIAGTTALKGVDTSWANCPNITGARSELWWVDLATKTAHRLDLANGVGYLPKGPVHHDADETLDYEPTVAPIVSGGYIWVAFTSRRLYGSVATLDPWCSSTNGVAFTPWATNPMTKKLWVAAFDLNAAPGTDASHPAFYFPGQELTAGNFRSFWVLDPCKSDGNSCETGDECCGGHCITGADGGALVCGKSNGCGGEGDTCVGASDCCSGLQCVGGPDNGHCDVIPVK
jgi:hypothetical protein